MSLLFPKRCVLCGAPLPALDTGRAALCSSCAAEVRTRYRCRTADIAIAGADGAAAALYYTGAVADAMKRLKFGHDKQCVDWFAAQTVPLLAARLDDWTPALVTFMPIGLLRRRARGYNQAELLAKAIAAPLSLPCRATLRKRPFVRRQSSLGDYTARQQNAARAFAPLSNADVSGRAIVLVDDIITSGATAAAAVRVLREMGAARVYVLAPTRAHRK